MDWDVTDLGRMDYDAALAVQRRCNAALIAGEGPETLLLVEHEPVVTLTNRPGVREHLLAPPEAFAAQGIAIAETDRGGDVTYHGPGQLVAYPILRLANHHLNLSSYMRLLERAVIQTAATYGITGVTECGATGVWVDGGEGRRSGSGGREAELDHRQWGRQDPRQARGFISSRCSTPEPQALTRAKLCALGVRIRKGTTLHGLALNVTTDLSHFALIDPCGLGGRPVTSLEAMLGPGCPEIETVKADLVRNLAALLDASRLRGVGGVGGGRVTGCSAA